MANKTKPWKTRAPKKARQTEAGLALYGEGGKKLADASLAKPVGELGVLRRMFKLIRGSLPSGWEREFQGWMNLVSDFEKRIAQSGTILRHKDFGVKNWRELAELFVTELKKMDIAPKTFRAFIANMRIEGYQSRVRGWLFHLYVRNLNPLQDDLLKWAMGQLDELNASKFLLDALGKQITNPVKFNGLPFKAIKIYVRKVDGTLVEFIDDTIIAFSGTGKERYMSFLTEMEVKTVAAARGLSEQIAFAQIRTGSKDTREIIVVGRQAVKKEGRIVFEGPETEIKFEPNRIVYSPLSRNRSGVTLMSANRWAQIQEQVVSVYESGEFKLRTTAKGGGESYLLIRLALNTDELHKIVRAIWPGF
jgi:hypothetical protein